jgi:glutaredoxin 2
MDRKQFAEHEDQNLVSVLLEPLGDKSDQELLDWLAQEQVEDAEVLAPRFISATLPENLIGAAERIARVSVKTRKQQR